MLKEALTRELVNWGHRQGAERGRNRSTDAGLLATPAGSATRVFLRGFAVFEDVLLGAGFFRMGSGDDLDCLQSRHAILWDNRDATW